MLRLKYHFNVINKLKNIDKVRTNPSTPFAKIPRTKSWQINDFVAEKTSYQQLKSNLSPYQRMLIETKSMQRPFTGMLWDERSTGFYHCGICNTRLFTFDHRFLTKDGFVSFWGAVPGRVNIIEQEVKFDNVNFARMDVNKMNERLKHQRCQCEICKSHLGAVFFDGPPPTFLRYSINSSLLNFKLLQQFVDPTPDKKRRMKIKGQNYVQPL